MEEALSRGGRRMKESVRMERDKVEQMKEGSRRERKAKEQTEVQQNETGEWRGQGKARRNKTLTSVRVTTLLKHRLQLSQTLRVTPSQIAS
jgi:hypothetical protein